MTRILRRSIPPSVRAIESASRRPTLCFVVRDDENKTGGMIVHEKNLPAEVGKTQTPPRSASEVIAEMAAKVARYPAKPKEEWEGMSAEEMFQRGAMHDRQENFAEAAIWWLMAAKLGHTEAEYHLGISYADGEGLTQDFSKATEWHGAVPRNKDIPERSMRWACRIIEVKALQKDFVEAANWFHKSAEQRYAPAQVNLGGMYYDGEGRTQDYVKAAMWWRRDAEQNQSPAQFNLGMLYAKGRGVSQNIDEAIKWYMRAAEQGNVEALKALEKIADEKGSFRYNLKMHRTLRRSIPPSVRAIESASRRPTLCFVVRDDKNKTGGMIVREKNLPAEVGKTQTPPRSASEIIAEMAEKQNAIMRKNQLSVEKREPRYKTLHEAAKNDCAESIAILVGRGADVNGHESIEYGHATGYTALGIAASCNSLNAIAELIKHGADVNAYAEFRLAALGR